MQPYIYMFINRSYLITDFISVGLWQEPEADVFRKRALELGVPNSKILVENRSANTGENVKFSYALLKDKMLLPRKVIIVQKPYMERRAYATFLKQWPGNTDGMIVTVTSPDISLLDYPNEVVGDLRNVISVMVGDMARIKLYEEKGFQIPQLVPESVQMAFKRLKNLGKYDDHMPK